MPRAAKSNPGEAKKGRGPKAHKLPERFPSGEVLNQTIYKKKWQLGDVIGQGGFGLIYRAYDVTDGPADLSEPYVIKIEPQDNGPLFCEIHFYQRVARLENMREWSKQKKLKYLSVPQFWGMGQHSKGGKQYRFLVLQHLSTDLYKVWEQHDRRFSDKTTFAVGLRMLDALEYIHDKGYCHADIKAANILLGYSGGKTDFNQVYLVDYGLAHRFLVDGAQKPYREDPKRAHDGTVEYASRDAHKGVLPARRGDLEILGYCMLEWMTGSLPWNAHISDKDKVRDLKVKYMSDLPGLLKACFGSKPCPEGLKKYLSTVSKLDYDKKPDYDKLRDFLRSSITNEWNLGLSEPAASPTKGVKRKSVSQGPSTPKKSRPSSSPLRTKQPGKRGSPAKKAAAAAVSSPALNGKGSTPKPRGQQKVKASPTKGQRTSTKGQRTPTKGQRTPTKGQGSPSQGKIIPGLGMTKAQALAAKAAKKKATGRSPKSGSKTSSADTTSSASGPSTPASARGRGRPVQKRRRNKAVLSSDSACQTSPGLALLSNGK